MRAFAGLLIATGVVVAVLSFFYTVGGGEVRLWPGVTVGVSIAALGIIVLAIRNLKP